MNGSVRPLELSALPAVSPAAQVLTREAARAVARLPASVAVPLRGVGTVQVSVVRLSFDPLPIRGERFTLLGVSGRGAVQLDAALALGIAAAVLGSPAPILIRPLGRAERGVVGAALATFLHGAGSLLGIDLDPDATAPGESGPLVHVALRVRGAGLGGRAALEVPLAWLPRAPAPFRAPAALSTAFSVVLGATRIAAESLAAAEAGDAVVFDEITWPPPSDEWPVHVRAGHSFASAMLRPDGLRLVSPFHPDQEDPAMTRDDRSTTAATLPATLAAAPVEIVAELGRITLRMDEVSGLLEGGVVSLGESRRDLVTLWVGDRAWARGELVTVDGALGVRITERLDR